MIRVWFRALRRTCAVASPVGLLAATLGAVHAQPVNDGIYDVIRQDAAARHGRSFDAPARGLTLPMMRPNPTPQQFVPEITVRPLDRGGGPTGARAAFTPGGQGPATPPTGVNLRRGVDAANASEADFEMPGGPRAFCVRSCDGFYFPAGPALSGDGRRAQQFACERMCPGAEVSVFTIESQGTIEDAVGPRGQVYARLRTAFRFRERLEAGCTCSGLATRGVAALPITHDFTLRPGDVVVTESGVRVFNGASRFPFRDSDFVEARNYSRLPADVRRRVAEIQAGIAARDAGAAAPVVRTAVSSRLSQTRSAFSHGVMPLGSGVVTAEGVRVLDISRTGETRTR